MALKKQTRFTSGEKKGKLTLIKIVGEKKYGSHRDFVWECQCECGKTCRRTENTLKKSQYVHSCGCYTIKNLYPKGSEHMSMCGKARAAKRNKDGCNVDMLFREKPIASNTSGVQGISWAKNISKWHVYIGYKGKRANLGYFKDIELAKKVREKGLQAIKEGKFEEFFEALKGKRY